MHTAKNNRTYLTHLYFAHTGRVRHCPAKILFTHLAFFYGQATYIGALPTAFFNSGGLSSSCIRAGKGDTYVLLPLKKHQREEKERRVICAHF